jgi:hypothetical protein
MHVFLDFAGKIPALSNSKDIKDFRADVHIGESFDGSLYGFVTI